MFSSTVVVLLRRFFPAQIGTKPRLAPRLRLASRCIDAGGHARHNFPEFYFEAIQVIEDHAILHNVVRFVDLIVIAVVVAYTGPVSTPASIFNSVIPTLPVARIASAQKHP